MREIKFRAWLKEHKSMIDVMEIDIDNQTIFYYWFGDHDGHFENFNKIDLMEYTGLKDMKGKEIYEGDILFESFSEEYFKVVFENGSFRAEDDKYSLDLEDYAHICEVVGNIYENPELIEDE